jgi:hypothetical protein
MPSGCASRRREAPLRQTASAGLAGEVAFVSAARPVPDRWPELGGGNCLVQASFAKGRIAIDQARHPGPRNVPIGSSIRTMGHHAPAPIEQPGPQLGAHACLDRQANAAFNLNNAGSDPRLGAATRQLARPLLARQRAQPVADRSQSIHINILALPSGLCSRALAGYVYVRQRTDRLPAKRHRFELRGALAHRPRGTCRRPASGNPRTRRPPLGLPPGRGFVCYRTHRQARRATLCATVRTGRCGASSVKKKA